MTTPIVVNWRIARQLAAALCVTCLAQGCGSSTIEPIPASLSGTVVLQDAWGNIVTDASGVDVTVDGFSVHAITDNSGAWHMDAAPSGTRDIILSKASYTTMHIPAQAVIAPATTAPVTTLTQPPLQSAIIDSVYVVAVAGHDTYRIDGHLSSPPPASARVGSTMALFGRESTVSADVSSFAVWGNGLDLTGQSTRFSISLSSDVVHTSFVAGTQAFVTAYAVSAACGCYTDPGTKHPVFAGGPRGNVVSLTVK